MVSPFLEEPLITTAESLTTDDSAIESIIENAQPPLDRISEEVTEGSSSPNPLSGDDTDLIGHTTPDTLPEVLLPPGEGTIEDHIAQMTEQNMTPVIDEDEIKKEIPTSRSSFSERSSDSSIPPEKRDKIVEIVSMVQTLIAR